MSVQQGLVTAEALGTAALLVRRDRRRRLVHGVVLDLLGGVRSLGELDSARGCRSRGRDGRYYLDVHWDRWRLVVEVDGLQHGWVEDAVADALRHDEVALTDQVVLRIPLLGLRLTPDDFSEQVRRALRSQGWRDAA